MNELLSSLWQLESTSSTPPSLLFFFIIKKTLTTKNNTKKILVERISTFKCFYVKVEPRCPRIKHSPQWHTAKTFFFFCSQQTEDQLDQPNSARACFGVFRFIPWFNCEWLFVLNRAIQQKFLDQRGRLRGKKILGRRRDRWGSAFEDFFFLPTKQGDKKRTKGIKCINKISQVCWPSDCPPYWSFVHCCVQTTKKNRVHCFWRSFPSHTHPHNFLVSPLFLDP